MVSHESWVSNNVKFLSVFKGFRMFSWSLTFHQSGDSAVHNRTSRRVELRRLLWTFAHSLGSTELLDFKKDKASFVGGAMDYWLLEWQYILYHIIMT